MMRTTLVAVLAAVAFAPLARADGDPASDFLYTRETFVPYDLQASASAKPDFLATVRTANREGFPIRVAVIGSTVPVAAGASGVVDAAHRALAALAADAGVQAG